MGIIFVYLDDDENEVTIELEQTGNESSTNNQMELKAVIEGLRKSMHATIPIKYDCIEVRTDSRYVVDNKNNAIYKWSKSGWLTSSGRPVENAPQWKELIKVLRHLGHHVEFVWVKGHAKDPYNKTVDRLAKQSAKAYLNPPITQVKLRRKKTKQITQRGSIEMKGQRVSIYIVNDEYLNLQKLSKYRYEIISKGSEYYQKIDFIYSELHHLKAGHCYLVTFNKKTANPRILKMIRELKQ